MGLFSKKKTPEVGVEGHEVHVNPKPLSNESFNRTVGRIDRVILTMNKIEDKNSMRYKGFAVELARLKAALMEYEHRKEARR